MRTVEEIKIEIGKVTKAQTNAERKIQRCEERLVELDAELKEAEKNEK